MNRDMAAKKGSEFLIVNRRSGKALQATGLDNGLVVEQAEINRGDAQIWTSVESGDGVKLFNKASGKVLDVMANGTENGTWAQTWEDVDGESQLWKIVPVTATYKKLLNVMSGKVLDIVDMSDEDGAPAQIWEDVDGENQQWKFTSLTATKTVKKPAAKQASAKQASVKKAPAEKKTAAKKAEETAKAISPAKSAVLTKSEPKPSTLTKTAAKQASAKPASLKKTETKKK